MEHISVDYFEKRLIDLFVRSRQELLPKKFEDRHIMLKSIVLVYLEAGRDYTEREINAAIQGWQMTIGRDLRVDVFTLRRELIDRKYLTRDKRGMCYQVKEDGYGSSLFDYEVENVDVMGVIETGRAEAEARKRAFMAKQKTA